MASTIQIALLFPLMDAASRQSTAIRLLSSLHRSTSLITIITYVPFSFHSYTLAFFWVELCHRAFFPDLLCCLRVNPIPLCHLLPPSVQFLVENECRMNIHQHLQIVRRAVCFQLALSRRQFP